MSGHWVRFAGLLVASLVLIPGPASAQESIVGNLKTILSTNISSMSTTITDASGAAITTETNNVYPQLTVSTDTLIYPNLRLNAGGIFDVNLSRFTTGAGESTGTVSRLRPFFELRSTNPIFAPGFGYSRREERTSGTGGASLNLIGEDYAGYLGWRPEGLPTSEFQFVRTNTFDSNRSFQDTTKDFGSIISRYTVKGLMLNYLGSYVGNDDKAHTTETQQFIHSLRVDDSMSFFAKRINWNTSYNANRQDITSIARGQGGEVAVPVIPFAGLSIVSDTPVTSALIQNPLLVDGNLTASAGISIGFPGIGPDQQARNIGLDFATPTQVNRLWIWVDRDLPADVSNSFSWELYSSPDNVTWTRETVITSATFGPFENHFELDFRAVTARYVKVVTRPLSGTVLDSTRFPDIFVTELQAFLTQAAVESRRTLGRTSQILNTDVRFRLLNAPAVFYEGSYWYTGTVSGPHRDILSNGASVFQSFARMFTVQGRAAREQGTEPQGPRVAMVENGAFTVTPISTFTGSFLFTGLNEEIAGRKNNRNSVILQTNTHIYRGFDVQVGGGWTFTSDDNGFSSRDGLLNVSASIVPRPDMNFTLNYVDTTSRPSGPFLLAQQFRTRRGYATVAVDPMPTLHLVFAEEVIATTGDKTRFTHNIGGSWAPFPDGSLLFIVAYNEALRDLYFGSERTFRPSVRWTFARQSWVEVSYQNIETDFVLQQTKSKIFSVDLRFFL